MQHIWRNSSSAYRYLSEVYGAGPYDGACYPVARALQREIGGALFVLIDGKDLAHHAVVKDRDGYLWDSRGPDELSRKLLRFNLSEGLLGTPTELIGARPFAVGDLEDSAHWGADNAQLDRIRSLFKRNLAYSSWTPSRRDNACPEY